MNERRYNELREAAWRWPLTQAEEAELRTLVSARSEAQAEWEAEAALTRLLTRLPDVPVASNFTARVLQAVEREDALDSRGRARTWVWRWRNLGWLPKSAAASLVLAAGLLGYHHHQTTTRAELARSVAAVSSSVTAVSSGVSVPSAELLADFEVIRRLKPSPPADEELLALLQ